MAKNSIKPFKSMNEAYNILFSVLLIYLSATSLHNLTLIAPIDFHCIVIDVMNHTCERVFFIYLSMK